MTILLVVNIFLISFCVFISIDIIRLDKKNRIAILIAVIAVFTIFLNLACIYLQFFSEQKQFANIYRAGTLASVFIYPLAIFTVLELSSQGRQRKPLLKKPNFLILAALAIILAGYFLLAEDWVIFLRVEYWTVLDLRPVLPTYVYFLYATVMLLFYAGVNIRWYGKSRYKREKKVAFISLLGALLIIVLFLGYTVWGVFITQLAGYMILDFGTFLMDSIVISLWICIRRYKLLYPYQQIVRDEIMTALGKAVLFVDLNGNITCMNEKMRSLLHIKKNGQLQLANILINYDKHKNLFAKLLATGTPVFLSDFFATSLPGRERVLDCRCTLIRDKFGEPLGMVLVAWEVTGLEQLKTEFGITDRENDILKNILLGSSNKEIASTLGITLNTVKRHITNIYNKMYVDNKVQLLNLLKRFN